MEPSTAFDTLQRLPMALVAFDTDERLAVWNDGTGQLGSEIHRALRPGLQLREFLSAFAIVSVDAQQDSLAWIEERLLKVRSGERDCEHRLCDGRWLLERTQRDAQSHTVCVFLDITEIKERELELRHAGKGEAIGEVSRGLTHQLNNLLQVIYGLAHLCVMDLDPAAPMFENLVAICEASQRAGELTRLLQTLCNQNDTRHSQSP
jgi:signal transduction histidine kinase